MSSPALDSALYMLTQMSDPRARFLYMYGPRGTGKTVQLHAFRDQCRTRAEPDILPTLTADQVATEEGMRQALFRPRIEMTGVEQDDADADPASDRKDRMDIVRAWLQRWRSSHSDLVRDVPALQPTEARLSAGFGSVILTLPKQPDRSVGRIAVALGRTGPDHTGRSSRGGARCLAHPAQCGVGSGRTHASGAGPGRYTRPDRPSARGPSQFLGPRLASAYGPLGGRCGARRHQTAAPQCGHDRCPSGTCATDRRDEFLPLISATCTVRPRLMRSRKAAPDISTRRSVRRPFRVCMSRNAATTNGASGNSWNSPDGLHVGRTIALAFRQHDNHLTTTQVQAELDALDPERTMDRWRFLRHKGYIWDGPVPGSWEPGIPSLMDYMIETTEPDPPTHSTSMI